MSVYVVMMDFAARHLRVMALDTLFLVVVLLDDTMKRLGYGNEDRVEWEDKNHLLTHDVHQEI
jgi:hypothetical protein